MAETKILHVWNRLNNAAQYLPFSFRAFWWHTLRGRPLIIWGGAGGNRKKKKKTKQISQVLLQGQKKIQKSIFVWPLSLMNEKRKDIDNKGFLLWSFIMVLYYGPLVCFSKCLKHQMAVSSWSFIIVLYYRPSLGSFIIVLYYRPLLPWLYSYLKHEVADSSLSYIMTCCSPLLWSFTMVLYHSLN